MFYPFTTYLTAAVASRLSICELIKVLSTDPINGLHKSEAERRLKCYGHNQPKDKPSNPIWLKYLNQFQQPMITLLLVSALVSLVFHQFDDAISISCAVIIVVTVGFIQEYRSEKALAALTRLLPIQTRCIRHELEYIPSKTLVPGDLILLENGDRVPADTRLLDSTDLLLDESTFTGENEFVKKDAMLKDRATIVYAGSTVRHGKGRGLVVATGEYSEFGAVLKLMRDETPPDTPLQNAMDQLSRQISIVSLFIICVIIFIGYVLGGYPFREILSIGVSLAVAAIPEGLPIVVTVTLALGVLRMANRNTIVRHIQSVETMGRISTVCFDKTGTITLNQMTLHSIVSDKNVWKPGCQTDAITEDIIEAGLLCNNAELYKSNGTESWQVRGQPTEGAIWLAMTQYFPHLLNSIKRWKRVKEWPFCSEKRWMAVEIEDGGQNIKIIMKGAVEVVLENCQQIFNDIDCLLSSLVGLRVLAIAEGTAFGKLRLLGLVGLFDPIRSGVKESIQELQSLHEISVMIITGDAEETAKHVGNELGLNAKLTLSGNEAEKLAISNGSFSGGCIFYRTNPKQKLLIIRALQRQGRVVAMVGDGINDAVALRAADVGISVGANNSDSETSDVSREAADIILLDDDIRSVVNAVEEGKCIFYNIQNFIRFQLSTSVAALSLIAIGTLFGRSPLNAMQILWINIIMDGPPAQSLGVEPADPSITKKKHGTSVFIVNKELIIDVALKALLIVSGTSYVFISSLRMNKKHQTTLTFTCFVLFDMFNALTCRSKNRPIMEIGFFSNYAFCYALVFSLVGQALVVYWHPLQYIFQTESISFLDILRLTFISSSVFFTSEFYKYYKRYNVKSMLFSV